MIRKEMSHPAEDVAKERWLEADHATYENPKNTHKSGKYPFTTLDYIFTRTRPNAQRVSVRTSSFELPMFKTSIPAMKLKPIEQVSFKEYYKAIWNQTVDVNENFVGVGYEDEQNGNSSTQLPRFERSADEGDQMLISFSDHEAVASTISVCT